MPELVANGCRFYYELDGPPGAADLHRITAPVLLMVGEEDTLKPRAYADIIAREIPHAAYAVIPRAGHAVCWEQPLVFNSLVLGFLEQQGRGGD